MASSKKLPRTGKPTKATAAKKMPARATKRSKPTKPGRKRSY